MSRKAVLGLSALLLALAVRVMFSAPAALAVDFETDTSGDGWSYEDGVLTVTSDRGQSNFEAYCAAQPEDGRWECTGVRYAAGVTRIDAFPEGVQSLSIGPNVTEIPSKAVNDARNRDGRPFQLASISVDAQNMAYYVENGLLIERANAAVLYAECGLRETAVPAGVRSIGPHAFFGCYSLESVILPDGLAFIGAEALAGTAITSLALPASLMAIYEGALPDGLDMLAVPANTRLLVPFDDAQGAWLIPPGVNTLLFCGMPVLEGEYLFFEAGDALKLVFWQEPPAYFDLSQLKNRAHPREITVCFRKAYAADWAPNGETEWKGLPLRELGTQEEQTLKKAAGLLLAANASITDWRVYPGWSLSGEGVLTVYSDAGMENLANECVCGGRLQIQKIVLAEGVTDIPAGSAYYLYNLQNAAEVHIPASVRRIDASVFPLKAGRIFVDAANPAYRMQNGVLTERSTGSALDTELGYSARLDGDYVTTVYTDAGVLALAALDETDPVWDMTKTLVLAEGVTQLQAALGRARNAELSLPASLRVIEKGALDRVNEVRLAAENAQYYMENGALYERATGTMIWEQWNPSSAEETPVSTPVSSPAQAQDDPPDNGWSHEDGVLTLTLDIWSESLSYRFTSDDVREQIPLDTLVIGPALKRVPRYIHAEEIRVDPDNPWYYAENGMLIERETARVLLAEWDLVDAVVPKGVLAIGENAFDNHEALRSVTFPEDLREIHEDAFYACNNLMHVALPESLTGLFSDAFFYCGFTELVLPPNVHFYLDIDGWGSPYDWSNIETLVVTDANINLWEREVMWTMPLKRLIFLCEPPAGFEGYDFEEMRKELRQEYSARNYEPDIAVCYLPEMAGAWTPNGETKWNGFQLRPLTEREVAEVKKLCGPLWGAKRREWDEAAYPGWSLDENRHMTVYTDAGLAAARSHTHMFPDSLTLYEGVTAIPGDWSLLFDARFDRVELPSTIWYIDPYCLRPVKEIRLSEQNPYFELRDGDLYDRDTGAMVWEQRKATSAEETSMAAQTPAPTPVLSPTPTATPAPAAVAGDEPSLFTRFIRAMTPLFLLLAIRTVFACALAVYCLQRRAGKRRRT